VGATPTTSYSKVPRNLDIPKPQKTFEHVPTNDETAAFKPLLTLKPHAIVPLQECLTRELTEPGENSAQYDAPFYLSLFQFLPAPLQRLVNLCIRFRHPYQKEIEAYDYPSSVYRTCPPITYHPFESTTATYVDTPEALDKMLSVLKQAKEIAIDLEAHDMRSYVGIVCLMQISTRDQDWIIDTLKPWRRKLECLNEVFADPKIIKVCSDFD
jgi:exosome complex exonuclease RRP6